VKQQSEHLSNAQIDQYGKRASGAGPETEAWVETHLDDCPSCRSRVLEFQRTQFALLPDPKVNTVSSSNCPCEEDLRNLAAGLCAEPIAKKLKAHASNCERCGPLLQEYIEDFSDESSPEEQAALAQLRSASPEWQRQKAREMLMQAREPELVPATDWRRLFSWKWIMVPALPAIALIAMGIWYLQRDTPEKVEKLLAQAYTEQRTMEMRWPGAEYKAFSTPERGPSNSAPPSTYEAKAYILRELSKKPNDPAWLRSLGQEQMLEWHSDEAITNLNRSLQLSPNSVPTMVDLAMAYSQRAELQQDVNASRQSIMLLSEALSLRPNDPVILFNRALTYQRMSPPLYESALADWESYLKIEPHGPWSDEARQHKRKIEELKKNSR